VPRIDALADSKRQLYPCRITFPGHAPETHHAASYGAPVVKGEAFTVLMSDGSTVAL
jgi:hypothetical protein